MGEAVTMDESFDLKKHAPIIGIFVLIVVLILASRKGGAAGGASISSYNQALSASAAADNDLARIDATRTVELARIKQSAFSKLLEFNLASKTVEAGERTSFMEATTGRDIALNTNATNAAIEAAKLTVVERLGFAALQTQASVEAARNASQTRIEEVRAALERERAAILSGASVAQAQATAAAQTAQAQAQAQAQRSVASSQSTSSVIGSIATAATSIFGRIFGGGR